MGVPPILTFQIFHHFPLNNDDGRKSISRQRTLYTETVSKNTLGRIRTPYTETPIPILLPCHSLKNPLKYGNMLQEHLRQTYSHFSTLALESWVQGLWVFRKILEVISPMGQTKHDTLGGSLFLHYRKEINRELNSLVVFFLVLAMLVLVFYFFGVYFMFVNCGHVGWWTALVRRLVEIVFRKKRCHVQEKTMLGLCWETTQQVL